MPSAGTDHGLVFPNLPHDKSAPSKKTKEALHQSCEAVPEHNRRYLLGDQDRRDSLIQVETRRVSAVRATASDVHVQPVEDYVNVRMRIDGILFDTHTLPKAIQEEVLTRIKVLGRMNIAEKRLPQDGRATVQVGQRLIDLRIASMPTSFGERIVIRLLDKSARLYTLQELGMDAATLERYRRAVCQEHGLVLVTGPTGSGKSTTLYASLMELDTRARNAVTLEDDGRGFSFQYSVETHEDGQ